MLASAPRLNADWPMKLLYFETKERICQESNIYYPGCGSKEEDSGNPAIRKAD